MPGVAVSRVGVRRVRADEGEKIRAARLAALAEEDFRSYFLKEEERLAPADWAARAMRGAESADFATFVAVGRDTLIGIADGLRHDEDTVEVAGMWVEPEQRGRGIGRQLLAALTEWAATQQATRLSLTVVTTNGPAVELYERAGAAAPVWRPLLA